jgi:hypothetical protein
LSNNAVAFDPAADRALGAARQHRGATHRMAGMRLRQVSFTRGAVFAAGAVERTLTERLFATGSLTHSRSTSDAASAEAYGLARSRTDASGGAAWTASPALLLFASVSRTLSKLDYDSSRIAFNAGERESGRARPAASRNLPGPHFPARGHPTERDHGIVR